MDAPLDPKQHQTLVDAFKAKHNLDIPTERADWPQRQRPVAALRACEPNGQPWSHSAVPVGCHQPCGHGGTGR